MTSYVTLKIICEGQTEETFIRDIISDEFIDKGIICNPFCVTTSVKSKTYRGGLLNYDQAKKDILRALKEKNAYVTTMFDLYKLPKNFPGKNGADQIHAPYEKISIIEKFLYENINNHHFIPYIQLHEFEALLFSDIDSIDEEMRVHSTSQLERLKTIKHFFPNPELINEGESTAPSKRLLNLYPSYQKVTDGIFIAKSIPLKTMKEKCSHFNEWIDKIEKIIE